MPRVADETRPHYLKTTQACCPPLKGFPISSYIYPESEARDSQPLAVLDHLHQNDPSGF